MIQSKCAIFPHILFGYFDDGVINIKKILFNWFYAALRLLLSPFLHPSHLLPQSESELKEKYIIKFSYFLFYFQFFFNFSDISKVNKVSNHPEDCVLTPLEPVATSYPLLSFHWMRSSSRFSWCFYFLNYIFTQSNSNINTSYIYMIWIREIILRKFI